MAIIFPVVCFFTAIFTLNKLGVICTNLYLVVTWVYDKFSDCFRNHQQIVPFRESKLTRIFQSFFCGKGKASMIVNVNQNASCFDETYHALKYSAVAKQVSFRYVVRCWLLFKGLWVWIYVELPWRYLDSHHADLQMVRIIMNNNERFCCCVLRVGVTLASM